jgi:GT2 family glycosyltransferase
VSTLTVVAVIVRWCNGPELGRCVTSLLDSGHPVKTVVVDSGSDDGGADRLAADFPSIDVIGLEKNHSFAYAANHGADQSDSDLILLLNPDTEVEPGSVESLVEYLVEHPEVAGAVPLLVNPDGSSQHDWQLRNLPRLRDLALGRPGPPAFRAPPSHATAVEQPAAAAWLIRRQVWDVLGGLETRFAPAWWEDVDFCARLRRWIVSARTAFSEGFHVVPEARVTHVGGASLRVLDTRRFTQIFMTNLIRYVRLNLPAHLWWLRWTLMTSLLARAVVEPRSFPAWIGAIPAVFSRELDGQTR